MPPASCFVGPVLRQRCPGRPLLPRPHLAARSLDVPGVLALWQIRLRSQWHVALAVLVVARVAAAVLSVEPISSDRSELQNA